MSTKKKITFFKNYYSHIIHPLKKGIDLISIIIRNRKEIFERYRLWWLEEKWKKDYFSDRISNSRMIEDGMMVKKPSFFIFSLIVSPIGSSYMNSVYTGLVHSFFWEVGDRYLCVKSQKKARSIFLKKREIWSNHVDASVFDIKIVF